MKRILIVGVTIIAVMAVFIIWQLQQFEPGKETDALKRILFTEFVKYYLQFVVVGVLGSLLIGEYNRSLQKKNDRKSLVNSFYDSLYIVYSSTKKIRSDLRIARTELTIDKIDLFLKSKNVKKENLDLSSLTLDTTMNAKIWMLEKIMYQDAMKKLEILKEEIDRLDNNVYANQDAFKYYSPQLRDMLKSMESYLKSIVQEYRNKIVGIDNDILLLDLSKLSVLSKFVYKLSEEEKNKKIKNDFSIEYRRPYRAIQASIKESRLALNDSGVDDKRRTGILNYVSLFQRRN